MVRALLVQTGSFRRWCGSVRQGTVDVQGSATAAAEAVVQAGALAVALVATLVTAEAGRGKKKDVKSHNPLPSSYRVLRVAEEPLSSNFR